MLAFFCVLAPAGAALSIDRIRKSVSGDFWESPKRSPWALRLIQIQISVGYLAAVWDKVHTAAWTNGTAVSYALRLDDVHRLATPAFVTQSVILVNILTYGTLALEFALAILVWNRRARAWVLAMGGCLHLTIDSSILIGFVSFAMLTSYLCFVPPKTATKFILNARDGVLHLTRRLRHNTFGLTRTAPASTALASKSPGGQSNWDVGPLKDDARSLDARTAFTTRVGSGSAEDGRPA